MSLTKIIELFDGELVVKEDGIYTKVHTYRHLTRDLEIIIVGNNKIGTPEYKKVIRAYLSQCELILHEGTPSNGDDKISSELESLTIEQLKELAERSPTDAFFKTYWLFFDKIVDKIRGVTSSWISTSDNELKEKSMPIDPVTSMENYQRFVQDWYRMIDGIDTEKKKALTDYLLTKMKRIDDGTFELGELKDVFIMLFSSNGISNEIISSAFVTARETDIVKEWLGAIDSKPYFKKVGTEYGVGHSPGFRRLLEKKGYARIKSEEIRAIAY